jgi:hypothetical protein
MVLVAACWAHALRLLLFAPLCIVFDLLVLCRHSAALLAVIAKLDFPAHVGGAKALGLLKSARAG